MGIAKVQSTERLLVFVTRCHHLWKHIVLVFASRLCICDTVPLEVCKVFHILSLYKPFLRFQSTVGKTDQFLFQTRRFLLEWCLVTWLRSWLQGVEWRFWKRFSGGNCFGHELQLISSINSWLMQSGQKLIWSFKFSQRYPDIERLADILEVTIIDLV